MLSFLRKTRKASIESGGTSSYILYAIGEIALVVVGILLALQINNWNDQAKDLRREKIALENLLKEQESNLGQLEEKIAGCQSLISADTFFLSLFDAAGPIQLDEKTALRLIRLASPVTFDPGNGVINDLINSGNINLIQNDSLKFRISEWDSELAEVKEAEQFLFDISVIPMKNYFLDNMAIRKAYQEYVGASQFEHDADLFRDRKFENLIMETIANLSFLENRYELIKEEIEEMIRIIKTELD